MFWDMFWAVLLANFVYSGLKVISALIVVLFGGR
jgi:hypothetical protein